MLHRSFELLCRLVLTILLATLGAIASAQTAVSPSLKWHSDGWRSANTSFSRDGSTVLVWNQNGFAVYNTASGALEAYEGTNNSVTTACIAPDGTKVYYALGTTVIVFNVSSRTQTYPNIGSGTTRYVRTICVSEDGTKLGFSNDVDNAYIFNLTTGALVKEFSVSLPGGEGTPASMSFIDAGNQILFDGPTVYDLSGNQIGAIANSSGNPAVASIDEKTIYTYNPNLGGLEAYSASTLKPVWQAPATLPSNWTGPAPSSDNQAVFVSFVTAGNWSIQGYSASTGSPLLTYFTYPLGTVGPNDIPSIAMSPTVNGALLGPGNEKEAIANFVSLNTATGQGQLASSLPLFEGCSPNNAYGVTLSSVAQFVSDDLHDSGNLTTLRNAATGVFSPLGAGGVVVSPDAKYYLQNVNGNIEICNINTGIVIATFPNGDGSRGFGWGATSSQFFVFDNYLLNLEAFNGTSIASVATVNTSDNYDQVTYLGDGKHLAIYNLNGSGLVQIIDTSTGKVTGSISPDTSSSGIGRLDAAQSNLLGVGDLSGSVFQNEYRVFSISSTGVPTRICLAKYLFPNGASSSDGTLSPDGRYIAMMDSTSPAAPETRWQNVIHLYRVSDGSLLQNWSPLPGGGSGVSTHLAFSADSTSLVFESGQYGAMFDFVLPPTKMTLTLNPSTVAGGASSTGTLTFDSPVPVSTSVLLTSSNTAVATVPQTVVVSAGGKTATFTVSTKAVTTATSVTISALDATEPALTGSATLTVTLPALKSLTLNPTTVVGGAPSTGTVTLNVPAPSGGTSVSLSSSIMSAATTPSSVTVAAGASSATFPVTTYAVSATTAPNITATAGAASLSTPLTVNPAVLSGVTLNPTSVIGGTSSTGTLTLSGPAPSGGAVVTLSSSNPNVASTTPSVTVLAGGTSATFTVTTHPVASAAMPVISATFGGTTATATLTVNPAVLKTFTISPSSVIGGSSATGTVTLNGPAPAGGTSVALSSSTNSATVPATVTVAVGATTASFTISTTAVTSNVNATITATEGGVSLTATLKVYPAIVATGLAFSPSTVLGGDSCTGTATINAPAPTGGAIVTLSSSNSSLVSVPATVTVPAGATSVQFSATTVPVATATSATVTAKVGSQTQSIPSAKVTVNPPTIFGVLFAPDTVSGGTSTTLYVFLTGPAASGTTLSVTSSSSRLSIGSTLTCVAGEVVQAFTLSTTAGGPASVTVKVSLNGSSDSAVLTITP